MSLPGTPDFRQRVLAIFEKGSLEELGTILVTIYLVSTHHKKKSRRGQSFLRRLQNRYANSKRIIQHRRLRATSAQSRKGPPPIPSA
jgi:hypothetical protein